MKSRRKQPSSAILFLSEIYAIKMVVKIEIHIVGKIVENLFILLFSIKNEQRKPNITENYKS